MHRNVDNPLTTNCNAPIFRVYSRPGCHLCEMLIEELVPLVRHRGCVEVLNIDLDEGLRARYGKQIPVVELDGRILCEIRLDSRAIEEALQNEGSG